MKQRVAIFAGLLVEAAMLLYPPWKVPGWSDDTYRFFSSPPRWTMPDAWYGGSKLYGHEVVGRIDTQRLGLQCLIVAAIVMGLVVLLGARKSKESN